MFEITIILLLILFNGLLAMSEIALLSSKKVILEDMERKGNSGAKTALKLLNEPEKFLSTIQIGITLVGIFAGAFGGLTLADDIEPFISNFGISKPYSYEISLAVVVTVITYLSLLFGELLPKTIALNNPESISVKLVQPIYALSVIATPLVSFLSISTKFFIKIFGIKTTVKPPVTEEELKMLIEQGRKYGILEQKETEMMKSVFRFYDRKIYSVMTPRQDIVWLNANDSIEKIKEIVYKNYYSKYPLCMDSLDEFIGILNVKDFLQKISSGGKFDIKKIVSHPLVVHENLLATKILERFRETKMYTAIVIDEYGSVKGMVTLHDMIENIFGDLPDIADKDEIAIYERSDGSFLVDGSIQLDELKDKFDLGFEETHDYSTLGGFVMYMLKRIPVLGDKFHFAGYEFEVVDMDGKRVDKVLIKKINQENFPQ